MRGVVMCGSGDVRVVDRDEPRIAEPTDAVIPPTATCICGSHPWPYRPGTTVAVVGDGAVGLEVDLGAEQLVADGPMAEAAAGCTAMDERRAIKVLLRP